MSAYLSRGQLLLSQHRYEEAETQFRRHLADEPDSPFAHVLLAESLIGRKRLDDAHREAQKAIGLDPESDITHATLARVLAHQDQTHDALKAIQQAITLDPTDADYRVIRASLLFKTREFSGALEEIETALKLDPENSPALGLRPTILQQLGRLHEADAASGEALRQQADDADSHIARGWVLLEQGQAKQAREHFRDALRLEPDNDYAKAGLVESIKATNLIYRGFLWYAFKMSRLGSGVIFLLIFGASYLSRMLRRLADNVPAVRPFVVPILVIYFAAVVITWIADPLANLVLRLHPDGRHALDSEQKRGSEILLGCLLAALACLATWWFVGPDVWLSRAAEFGLLMLPASNIMTMPKGLKRWGLAGVCLLALVLIGAGLVSEPQHDRLYGSIMGTIIAAQLTAIALSVADR